MDGICYITMWLGFQQWSCQHPFFRIWAFFVQVLVSAYWCVCEKAIGHMSVAGWNNALRWYSMIRVATQMPSDEFSLFLFQTNGTFTVQPSMTTVEGSCGGTAADLTLKFKEGHISFMFNKVFLISYIYHRDSRIMLKAKREPVRTVVVFALAFLWSANLLQLFYSIFEQWNTVI